MNDYAKKSNILAFVLTAILMLSFLSFAFQPAPQVDAPSGEETEEETGGENNGGNEPVEEGTFPTPPNLVTALSAWKYAEGMLATLSHWESRIRGQEIKTPYSFAGQSVNMTKIWDGPTNAQIDISTILSPGKTFGVEFYEMQKRMGDQVFYRRTSKQTSKREPIWENEGTTYTQAQFLAKRGILPLGPTFVMSSSTVINGSKRVINDGTTLSFTLELKAAACVNYATQITDASGSSTPAKFKDGGVKLDVVMNAKTGLFVSIKSTEAYNVTVMGMNTDITLSGTEKFSAYRV